MSYHQLWYSIRLPLNLAGKDHHNNHGMITLHLLAAVYVAVEQVFSMIKSILAKNCF